jgi:Protein of unknown function (DUF2975)
MHIVYRYPEVEMRGSGLNRWLRWLRAMSTFVYIAALCLGVALLVIAFVPGSAVRQQVPVAALSGLDHIGGIDYRAAVDRAGRMLFTTTQASLPQRLLYLATMLPGLLLIAEIARRMGGLLRGAQDNDPFTPHTASALAALAKVTAFGGFGVWVLSQLAQAVLSGTLVATHTTIQPDGSLLGWVAVGLIFAAFGQLITRGVDMRAELDAVI